MTDPFVGHVTYIRVYSGVLKAGQLRVTTRRSKTRERIGRLLRMHANKREEIEVDLSGRHCRLRRTEKRHHRRHAVR